MTTPLRGYLNAIASQVQLSGALGAFLQKLVTEVESSHPPQAAAGTYVETAMSSLGPGQALGLGTDVKFDRTPQGDITYTPATGIFRLAPLAKYRLTAHFSLGNYSGETVNVLIEWVDNANNLPLVADHGALLTPGDNTNSINVQPTADLIYETGAHPRDVKCRVTATLGTATALAGGCHAIVEALP